MTSTYGHHRALGGDGIVRLTKRSGTDSVCDDTECCTARYRRSGR